MDLVFSTQSPQLPQFRGGVPAGCGVSVCPAPGSGVAPATAPVAGQITGTSRSATENSAELKGLRRDMADIVAPRRYLRRRELVTPCSRLCVALRGVAPLALGAAGRRGPADQVRRHVVVDAAVAL